MNRRHMLKMGGVAAWSTFAGHGLYGCGGGGGGDVVVAEPACASGTFAKGLEPATAEILAQVPSAPRVEVNPAGLPASWDNTANLSDFGYRSGNIPAVRTQGGLGSCVAWGAGYCMATAMVSLTGNSLPSSDSAIASPAHLYAKLLAKRNFNCSSGTYVKDALDILVMEGVLSLADRPYSDKACTSPSGSGPFSVPSYFKIEPSNINEIRIACARQAIMPFGMTVYRDFENIPHTSDFIYSHAAGDNSCPQGGHCMAIVGYDDSKNAFKIMNSWSTTWGNQGFSWISYDTFLRLVSEVYVPYREILPFGMPVKSSLISDPASAAGGVTVIDAKSYNNYNSLYPTPNSINIAFTLSDAIQITGYGIYYVDRDPTKNLLLASSKPVAWVKGATYSADISNTTLIGSTLKSGSVIALSIGAYNKSGQPISLIAYTSLYFNSPR